MFERKVRRKHSREALENCSTHIDSDLTRKNKTRLLRLANDEEKKFITLTTGVNVIKLSFCY
jgi:hypothetical protein